MTRDEVIALAQSFKEANSLAWASETPLLSEMADLVAKGMTGQDGFDPNLFLSIAKSEGSGNGFWTISWKEANGIKDERLFVGKSIGEAWHWLLDIKPYLQHDTSSIRVKPYKALERKGLGWSGIL